MTEPETSVSADESAVLLAENAPAVVVPDRADAPVSEVTERFLRAVIAKVPLERIEELHLFAPLKQGGVETGIAVVAARVPVVTPPPPDESSTPPVAIELALDPAESTEAVAYSAAMDDAEVPVDSDNSPYLDEVLPMVLDGEENVSIAVPATSEPTPPIVRHTVYTARYRLVLKGPERGRWEADVVDEADAPLITVEMVVRGVQRRAGEETEILRYSDRQIARALHMTWPLPIDHPESAVAATVG